MCGIGALLTLARVQAAAAHAAASDGEDASHSSYLQTLLAWLKSRGPDSQDVLSTSLRLADEPQSLVSPQAVTHLSLASTVLHMRGSGVCRQPVRDSASGNVFAWNGELFGGMLEVDERDPGGDTAAVFHKLQELASEAAAGTTTGGNGRNDFERSLTDLLSCLHGPFACLFFCPALQTLYFGRDPLGRRSLLLKLPSDETSSDSEVAQHIVISSCAIPSAPSPPSLSSSKASFALGVDSGFIEVEPRGVYALRLPLIATTATTSSSALPRASVPSCVVWEGCAARGLGGWRLDVMPWNRSLCLSTLPRSMPAFLLPDDAPKTVGFASDDEVAKASLVLLRALNESVSVRVANAPLADSAAAGRHDDDSMLPQERLRLSNLLVRKDCNTGLNLSVSEAIDRVLASAATSGADRASTPVTDGSLDVEGIFRDQQAIRRLLPSNALEYLRSLSSEATMPGGSENPSHSGGASVAVLFSGGLDSMVLAALAHHHVPADQPIDLINVCFASPAHNSPDRQGAIAGVRELRSLYPSRCWQLLCADESVANVYSPEQQRVTASLLYPRLSHMDFNIGSALWYASGGVGWVDVTATVSGDGDEDAHDNSEDYELSAVRGAELSEPQPYKPPTISAGGAAKGKAKNGAATSATSGRNDLRYGGIGGKGSNLSDFDDASATAGPAHEDRTAGAAGDAASPHDKVAAVALALLKAEGIAEVTAALSRTPSAEGHAATLLNRTLSPADCTPASLRAGTAVTAEESEGDSDPVFELSSLLVGRYGGKDLLHPSCPLPPPPPAVDTAASSDDAAVVSAPSRVNPATGKIVAMCAGVSHKDGAPCKSGKPAKCANGMCKSHCKHLQLQAFTAGSPLPACHLHPLSAFDKGEFGPCPTPAVVTLNGAAAIPVEPSPAAAESTSSAASVPVDPAVAQPQGRRHLRVLVKSSARVLLSGLGADEQLAGYARHRTAWMHGGWRRLGAELDLDVDRLWYRNLGRDDRLISSHGVELRLPYLDEQVQAVCKTLPLHALLDLRLPFGVGDKRSLRVCASLLGLRKCALLVKRAIHFGSRIAKQSNIRAFGSNAKGDGAAAFTFDFAGAAGAATGDGEDAE